MAFTHLKNSDNLAKIALITAGSEDANFPQSKLVTLPVSDTWRSAEGQISSVKIRLDLDVARAVDTFAIVGHNLTSGATITLNGGSSPDPDGSEFQQTITHEDRTAWVIFAATQTFKHWALILTDEANTNGFLEIGYLVMGAKTAFAARFQPEWSMDRNIRVRRSVNDFGVPLVGGKLSDNTVIRLQFETTTVAEKDEVDDFLRSLDRSVNPLLFIPDPTESEAFFGRLQTNYQLVRRNPQVSVIPDLEFSEDNIGVSVKPATPFDYEVPLT